MEQREVLRQYPEATLLKAGGQKTVYKIEHPEYGTTILKVGKCVDMSSMERIRREVFTLRQIDSPYYPKNYSFEVDEGNQFLILEQYIDAPTLTKRLQDFQKIPDALGFVVNVAKGLDILWGKNIVHRDLKPDNVLVDVNNRPIIIDLGIARLLDEESITRTLALRGPMTQSYAAPEQIAYSKAGIDWRTDQFNLGIMLMQLIMGGKHPFDPRQVGSGRGIAENLCHGNWCRNVLQGDRLSRLRRLLDKMLSVEHYQRFRKPSSLISELTSVHSIYERS